ncbi:MAG: pyridoxal phosphate-dependent aminotransferase [Thermoplasmata archaeon]|nr:pyridoxal phosphate-dependent aminotransferase [Thermoplasmata archaeon]
MRSLSKGAERLRGNAAFDVLARAKDLEKKGKKILHFEIGEPDFDTPRHISDAAVEALHQGKTHYVNSYGIPELRKAICDEVEKTRGFRPDMDQVLVTPGANPIIFFAASCLVEQSQNIALQDPGFLTYYSVLQYTGIKGNLVTLKEENEFRLDPEDLNQVIDDNTRLIVVNSPSNPTGGVMTKAEIERVAEIAEEKDLYLLSDEIYSKMTYDRPFHTPSIRDECKERTIILDGFSKAYAMTGWRLGYAVGPKKVIEKMGMLLQATVSCTPDFLQYGAIAALEGSQYVDKMMAEFTERRNVLISGLNSIPSLSCVNPQGAFYAFPNITKTGMNSKEFADFALDELGIALLPGTAFGPGGEGYVRLSYATGIDKIKEAIERLKAGLE